MKGDAAEHLESIWLHISYVKETVENTYGNFKGLRREIESVSTQFFHPPRYFCEHFWLDWAGLVQNPGSKFLSFLGVDLLNGLDFFLQQTG